MSRRLFASPEEISAFINSAQTQLIAEGEQLSKKRFQNEKDGEVSFTFKLKNQTDNKKAYLTFAPKAYLKMMALVINYSTEVEWHGLVQRVSENEFLISDILVFPHEVTSCTVVSTQKDYEEWLDSLDDETFNSLRFHGHSHVNMAVTPSGTDMNYRKNVINNFGIPTQGDDYFYIFIILNKRGEISGEIYDLTNNSAYDTNEINILVQTDDDSYLSEFMSEARRVVKEAHSVSYGYYNSNTTPAVSSAPQVKKNPDVKIGAKASARQGSLFDDTEEDDWYNDIYRGGNR